MATYLIAFAKLKDTTKLQEYSGAAAPTLVGAGGTIVGRGRFAGALAGSFEADSALIVKFESTAAAKSWYESAAYQALIPLRDQVMSPTFVLVEEPT